MQTDLFQVLDQAYRANTNRVIQALDLHYDSGNELSAFENTIEIDLQTRDEQIAFLARVEAADREFEGMKEQRKHFGEVRGAGYDAAQAGKPKTDNPHDPVSFDHLFWYKGWCQGKGVFPVCEIPMKDIFALDRPVTRFKATFRIDTLLERTAEKILAAERPGLTWAHIGEIGKKQYLVKAAAFLEVLMASSQLALPSSVSASD
jgi:hypothetical protein